MESSPTDAHLDIATRIVKVLSDINNDPHHISKEIGEHVLKPFIEKVVSNAVRMFYKIPVEWYT